MMRLAMIIGICLPWFIACGSESSGDKDRARAPTAKPPVVVLPSQNPETPPASVPGAGTGTRPPVNPPSTPPAAGSVEAAFTLNVSGRWRAYCERNLERNTSRFYAVEFLGARWSTMIFEFTDNSACIGVANPNDGRPRTYRYNVKVDADGWFRVSGTCVSNANGCQGQADVLVKILENDQGGKSVQMKKVQGQGLWFRPGLEEDNYFW